jgi:hypothetical protein
VLDQLGHHGVQDAERLTLRDEDAPLSMLVIEVRERGLIRLADCAWLNAGQ